jgi:hypothetical protein
MLKTVLVLLGILFLSAEASAAVSDSHSINLQTQHLCPDFEYYAEHYANYTPPSEAERIERIDAFVENLSVGGRPGDDTPNSRRVIYGFSAGLNPRNLNPVGADTYALQPNTPYTMDFFVYYFQGAETLDLRYVAFLNEQQFDISENARTLYQPLTLAPQTAGSFSFSLPPLAPGIYDLVMFGIPINVDNLDIAENGNLAASAGRRISLVVGDELHAASPTRPFTSVENYVGADMPRVPGGNTYTISLHRGEEETVWSYRYPSQPVAPGETLDARLRVGWQPSTPFIEQEQGVDSASSAESTQIALVMIRNYEQVAFDSESLVRYVELPPKVLYTDIPLALTARQTEADEDLVAVRIDNPGVLSCTLSPAPEISPNPGLYIARAHLIIEG